MDTLERIVDEVKALPEFQAQEVLDFVGYLKSRRAAPDVLQTGNDDADWAEFEKLACAWTGKFNRGECYDRTILR